MNVSPPALGVEQPIGDSHAGLGCHECAPAPGLNFTFHRFVGGKDTALRSVTAGGAEKEGVEADQPASGDLVLHVDVTVFVVPHIPELGHVCGQVFGQHANAIFAGADVQDLEWFVNFPVYHFSDG